MEHREQESVSPNHLLELTPQCCHLFILLVYNKVYDKQINKRQINYSFQLTGFLLLIAGIVVLVAFSEYDDLLTKRFFNVTGFVIATGVIILLGSGLGFYSAISQQFYFVAGVSIYRLDERKLFYWRAFGPVYKRF